MAGESNRTICRPITGLCGLQQKEINVAGNNPPLIRKRARADTQYIVEPFAGAGIFPLSMWCTHSNPLWDYLFTFLCKVA